MLGINAEPVTIKKIECAIIDYGFEQGWIKAQVKTKCQITNYLHSFSFFVVVLSSETW